VPGFLKVDDSQKPIAVPYLKESGTWKPIAIGYIKVEGTWRIWYTAEVVDDFNRADSSTLGTASDDFSEWENLAGTWEVSNNAAETAGTEGPHLAAVQMYKATTDVIVEADLIDGTGLGAAFWVQDANNWWAAIPGRRTQSNPSFYTCPQGFTLEGDRCRRTTVYTASYEGPSTTTVAYCPSPYYDTGSGCGVSLYPLNDRVPSSRGIGCRGYGGCAAAGGSCSYSQGCADGGFGPCNCVITTYITTCTCQPFGGSCSNCSGTFSTGYSFRTVSSPGRGYYCPQGGSISGTTCTLVENDPADLISSYDTYPSVIRVYKRNAGNISQEFITDIGSDPTSVNNYVQTVSSSYSTPNDYRQDTGKSGSTIRDEYIAAVGSDPASFKVETSGNNINVKVYTQSQVEGNPYSSKSFQSSGAVKTTGAGIVKYTNQPVNQATRLDNFRAE